MSKTETWRATETRTVLWKAIKAAGFAGIGRKALEEATGKSPTSVDWHLTNMVRDGHVARPPGYGHGRWAAGPTRPPIEGLVLELALEMLQDCPAGVGEKLMCSSIACSLHELGDALQPLAQAGQVERMFMPATHGGGPGWRLPEMVDMLRGAHDLDRLPVMEIDIDRVHRTREDKFDARLADGRLHITTGALSFTLNEAHTNLLLQYLLAEVAR